MLDDYDYKQTEKWKAIYKRWGWSEDGTPPTTPQKSRRRFPRWGWIIVVVVLIAAIVPFTPAMPPTEYIEIPSEVPEELWGHTWGMLIGGGVNTGGRTESGSIAWLPGWSRDEYLNVNEPSISWKWIKDGKVVYEYKLLPNKCVKIGRMSVEFTIEPKDPYWKYDVSQCSWW